MSDQVQFGCGEFIPGKRVIKTPTQPKPIVPPKVIPVPPVNPRPPFPVVPPAPPNEPWVCVCEVDSPIGADFCVNGRRKCLQLSQVPPMIRRGAIMYATQADCVLRGFNQAPCKIESWHPPAQPVNIALPRDRPPDVTVSSQPVTPVGRRNNNSLLISSIGTGATELERRFSVTPIGRIPSTIRPPNSVGVDRVFNLDDMFSGEENVLNGSGIYDEGNNILTILPKDFTEYVTNNLYTNIFKTEIAKEVSYILNIVNTDREWKETAFTQLSMQRVLDSLRDDVLITFDNVILPGGKKLGRVKGADLITKLLFEGRLDEFDINFFKTLLTQQYNVDTISIQTNRSQELRERAALSYIAETAKSMDPNNFDDREKIEIARLKALLTDIDASVSVEYVQTSSVPLEDPGLAIFSGTELVNYVDVGIGDGYYFSVEVLGQEAPVNINTTLSSTYYVSIYDKQVAFDILGEPLPMKFSVSSTIANSELSSTYNESFSTSALFFKLNLSSIEDLDKTSSFVDTVKLTYDLITDLTEARKYSHTYGAMSVTLNLDYRDPFIQYASESELLTLVTKDITFRAFVPNKGPNYSNLIRQVPFIVIIQPGSGSEHNPFMGHSHIDEFRNIVTRSVDVMPYFPTEAQRKSIDSKLLYDVSSVYRLGLVGISDTQNFVYDFNPTNFSATYENDEDNIHRFVYYNVIKQILEQKYDFDSLPWFEVLRRLPAKKFGEFLTQFNRNFYNYLSNGSEGYRIRYVLNREGNTSSLTEINPAIEDRVYLSDGRTNVRTYA